MNTKAKLYWNDSEIDFNKISIKKSDELKNNKMEITLSEDSLYKLDDDIKFEVGDSFKVYAKTNTDGSTLDTSTNSPYLVFNGTLKEMDFTHNGSNKTLKLSCADSTFELLNSLWSKNYEDTAPNIIKNVVEFGSLTAESTYTVDISFDNSLPYSSGIQNIRPDSSSFPTKSFGKARKPIYEFIDELSQPEFTNTKSEIDSNELVCKRPFKYFIDSNNIFHWFYPTDAPDYLFKYGASGAVGTKTIKGVGYTDNTYHRIREVNLNFSQFDEVNFIIYKAGEDMDNIQVEWYALDPTAESLTTNDSFRSWLDITRNMKKADSSAGNITYDSEDKYNYPTSYPVTPAWNTDVSVSNDTEYNNEFREEAKRKGNQRCQREFDSTGTPRWKGKITIDGEVIEPTNLIYFEYPELTFANLLLRIESVDHDITKTDFNTTLNVKEDMPERGE